MLRTTTEAMSAAIGGANVIQVDPFDAVYRKPDAFSMRMARNQQIILKEESWLNKVIDPSAGSYYIENLTLLIAEKSWETFREIEKEDGFCKAFANGSVREKIELIARQRMKDIATRKTIVLGTNQYPNTLEKSELSHEPVSGVTQEVSSEGLRFLRLSEEFEIMRRDTEKFEQKNGEPVKIFLLTIGNPAMRKARAMFATNFFGCAGFSVIDNNGFPTIEEGFKAWKTSAAEILVLCSSDEEYAGFVPELCGLVKAELPGPLIIVAGFPKDQIEEFKALGVDDFIHIRSNVLETLTQYQVKLGIK
jgi:methylmalonyl-CoA mutase